MISEVLIGLAGTLGGAVLHRLTRRDELTVEAGKTVLEALKTTITEAESLRTDRQECQDRVAALEAKLDLRDIECDRQIAELRDNIAILRALVLPPSAA